MVGVLHRYEDRGDAAQIVRAVGAHGLLPLDANRCPKYFAAAFPVCEALYDNTVSDKALQKIVHLPIWFTHAKNDPIVKPEETVIPTYKRLIAAGAGNVHFTYWDKIEDIHEGFRDAEGKPYEYIAHFAWIPVLNDDCRVDYNGRPVVADGKEVGLLEWLSMQKK